MIVVEKNEWVPELNYTMKIDNLTGTRIGSFFAKYGRHTTKLHS